MTGPVGASGRLRYHLADVFTGTAFAGNPLAVLADGRGLTAAQLRLLAREFNYSEITAVLPPDGARATARVVICTPTGELPFAGHPTLGTAAVLAATRGLVGDGGEARLVLAERIGPVPVTVRAVGATTAGRVLRAELTAPEPPELGPPPPPVEVLAELLSLDPADLDVEGFPPATAGAGVRFTVVPVRDLAAMRRIRLSLSRWDEVLAGSWAPQVYAVCRETTSPEATLHVRMFSPALGVLEDNGTGAAAVAYAGYAAAAAGTGTRRGTLTWTIEQGEELGRRSLLRLRADVADGTATAVRLAGDVVLVGEGTIAVPPPAEGAQPLTAATGQIDMDSSGRTVSHPGDSPSRW